MPSDTDTSLGQVHQRFIFVDMHYDMAPKKCPAMQDQHTRKITVQLKSVILNETHCIYLQMTFPVYNNFFIALIIWNGRLRIKKKK